MDMLKKEWKSILVIIWIIGISLYLFNMKSDIKQIHTQSAKIADTLETVEGVIIGADAGVLESNKRMENLESKLNYIVKKVKRR